MLKKWILCLALLLAFPVNINAATLPTVKAGSKTTPKQQMIDIASYNGAISVDQYKKMKKLGIKVVVVKITEGNSYVNPYAYDQIHNALSAGLKVGAYHYAWHNSNAKAKKEAQYFLKYAAEMGLPKDAIVVDDVEQTSILKLSKLTTYTLKWFKYVKAGGYKRVSVYASANVFKKRILKVEKLGGTAKTWVAAYPSKLTATMSDYNEYSAWQFSSRMKFSGTDMPSKYFDVSVMYNTYYQKPQISVSKFAVSKTKLQFKVNNYSGEYAKIYIYYNKKYKYYKKYKINKTTKYVTITGKKYKNLNRKFHKYGIKKGRKVTIKISISNKKFKKKFKVKK